MPLQEGEELAQLFDGRLRIIQKKEGYRFSLDAILLAHFTSLIKAHSIVDLGTGSGIIPLVLARKMISPSIVGVEVQEQLADMARRTVALNGLTGSISILHNDLRNANDYLKPSSFDLVVPFHNLLSFCFVSSECFIGVLVFLVFAAILKARLCSSVNILPFCRLLERSANKHFARS